MVGNMAARGPPSHRRGVGDARTVPHSCGVIKYFVQIPRQTAVAGALYKVPTYTSRDGTPPPVKQDAL